MAKTGKKSKPKAAKKAAPVDLDFTGFEATPMIVKDHKGQRHSFDPFELSTKVGQFDMKDKESVQRTREALGPWSKSLSALELFAIVQKCFELGEAQAKALEKKGAIFPASQPSSGQSLGS